MTEKEFIKKIRSHREAMRRLIGRTLPIKAGARAVSFFQENFRKGGFQGATFQIDAGQQLPGQGRVVGEGIDEQYELEQAVGQGVQCLRVERLDASVGQSVQLARSFLCRLVP